MKNHVFPIAVLAFGDEEDVLVETIHGLQKSVAETAERSEKIEKRLEELGETQYPHGIPGSFHIRKGEDPLTSRPYSLMALAKAMVDQRNGGSDWRDNAKVECELSDELKKGYHNAMGWSPSRSNAILVPLSADLMPTESRQLDDGSSVDGLDRNLVAKCRNIMKSSMAGLDADEIAWVQNRLAKDLSSGTAFGGSANAGDHLVALAAQGELLEHLKATEVMSQVGATQIDLPMQGQIRFPRQTGSLTIAATQESATITESTPVTEALTLVAKPYAGLVDIPDEMMRFSTSVAVEAWLRSEFLRQIGLQTDKDMIDSDGTSNKIKGIMEYAGISTVIASTVGASGDTLEPNDPARLYAAIADQNAPVDRGFFYAMTHTLWADLVTRRADAVSAADGAGPFVFNAAQQQVGADGKIKRYLGGHPVVCSTQIPTDRVKTATDLTAVIGGVPSEWMIARLGVIEVDVTNADNDKFQKRITTMRGVTYMDAGPRHEESFGMIDDLVNG